MKGVKLFLADGFEDMEAVATRDVLIRGGVEVETVSVSEDYSVESSHGLTVIADMNREDFLSELQADNASAEDVMIFPGGMPGSRNLAEDSELMDIMARHYGAGGSVAAICAAPGLVASQLPGLEGKRFTCFEGFQNPLIANGAVYCPDKGSVVDGRLITGRGAGYAVEFGFAILEYLKGPAVAAKVRAGVMVL